ncbi:MAG: VWA domain-containing protein [Anaerolineaceae bacterium]|nr:VWA domain-containing protein [Anaerolineaceae bacterium]
MTLAFLPGLLGLLLLPAIVALHLMRERQRRQVVSSLALWAFLEPEVRGSRPRRIPLTLLLILDLLLAALFSLALAQPHVQVPIAARSSKQVLILLDTSTSMLARDEAPTRFARAQADIAGLLGGLGARDSAALITFGSRPGWVGDTRSQKVQDLLSALYEIKPGETGSAVAGALALGLAQVQGDLPVEVHIFSDAAYPDPQLGEVGGRLVWHLFGKPGANQAVIDLSTTSAQDDNYQVFAQLANFSTLPVARNITLLVDGKAVDSYSYSLPANSITPQVWYQQGQPGVVTVKLTGGDLLKEDDSASSGFQSGRQAQVVLVEEKLTLGDSGASAEVAVEEKASAVAQALNSIAGVSTREVLPADYTALPAINLTIFSGWLPERLPDGDVLVVQPPEKGTGLFPDGLSAGDGTQAIPNDAVLQIDSADTLLQGLDFSGVRWGEARKFGNPLDGYQPLMALQFEGQTLPLLLRKNLGQGHIYLLTAELSRGNLTRHPAFPILLAKMVQASVRSPLAAQIHVGEKLNLPEPGSYRSVAVTPPEQAPAVFQREWPLAWEATNTAGTYSLELEGADGIKNSYSIGVNAGSLLESDITPRDWARQASAELSASGQGTSQDLSLAPWILALAILILFWEASVAWR